MVFFSTGVDNNGNEFFRVSPRVWYFPAVAIPCTFVVIVVYQIWRRNREGRMVKRRKNSLLNPERVDMQRTRSGSTVALSIARMRVNGQSAMDEEDSIEMNAGGIPLNRL
jgi:hypothetical protein